jgi:hypothetical protein
MVRKGSPVRVRTRAWLPREDGVHRLPLTRSYRQRGLDKGVMWGVRCRDGLVVAKARRPARCFTRGDGSEGFIPGPDLPDIANNRKSSVGTSSPSLFLSPAARAAPDRPPPKRPDGRGQRRVRAMSCVRFRRDGLGALGPVPRRSLPRRMRALSTTLGRVRGAGKGSRTMSEGNGNEGMVAVASVATVAIGVALAPAMTVLRIAVALAEHAAGGGERPSPPSSAASILILRDGELQVVTGTEQTRDVHA